ncbi:ubiquitin carboxyl-terminal hydrolase 36-like, partial [Saccoglossus kowalevskii]|uniref:Ubiquitin carboxyl-terminal hydrolase 36 n=1 Tax=Saccoglossus kowalevskii TaxID=10224 RepID=A0ABM0GSM7_SACKO
MTIDVSLKKELSSHRSKNKDSIPDGLDQRIVSSSKQVLLCKIDFTPAEQSFSYSLSNLRTKYVSLNPKKSNLTEGETDQRRKKGNKMGTGNEKTAVEASDGIPKPRQTLFQPDKVRLSWHKVYRIGAGLMNLGNTCFLNSILQCLTYTPPLTNYLLSQQHSQSCREAGFCMMCELQRHAGRAFHQCGSAIRPMVIIQKIKNIGKQFRYGHQEDAHEFLRCVTEAMQKSCLVGYEKLEKHSKETTLVHQIFGGYYRSRVQCNKCQEISDTHDPFLDISLDIKHVPSIIKALERMIKPETLDNDNMYMCKRYDVT